MYNKKRNILLLFLLLSLFSAQTLSAQSASQIDAEIEVALKKFKSQVKGGSNFLPKVSGYLIFPSVVKAGFIVGGKYGKGALRVNGITKDYYSLTSASIGLQAGAQEHAMLIAFLSEASLQNFIKSNGWEAGVDGTIAISDWGQSKDISSISFEKPIVGFIFGERGFMASVSIAGTKFQKIIP